MYDDRINLARQVAAEIRNHFGAKVYESVIPRNVRLGEAPSFGKPVMLCRHPFARQRSLLSWPRNSSGGRKQPFWTSMSSRKSIGSRPRGTRPGHDEQRRSPGLLEVALDSIVPNALQPRKHFDESAIEELANSVRQHGIVQPLVVTRSGDRKVNRRRAEIPGHKKSRPATCSGRGQGTSRRGRSPAACTDREHSARGSEPHRGSRCVSPVASGVPADPGRDFEAGRERTIDRRQLSATDENAGDGQATACRGRALDGTCPRAPFARLS